MVDRYRRKIGSIENDIENSMQISSILQKLKAYDEKLADLLKIDTNKNNISSNLEKINDNEDSIFSNLSKINDNENSISNNLGKIDNFTQYILKSAKDFEQTHTIEKQIFRFNRNKHFYTILKKKLNMTLLKIVYYL